MDPVGDLVHRRGAGCIAGLQALEQSTQGQRLSRRALQEFPRQPRDVIGRPRGTAAKSFFLRCEKGCSKFARGTCW